MSARGRGRKNHRTRRSPGAPKPVLESTLEELEVEIASTREFRKRCIAYLEAELETALSEGGNDVKVLRLLKGIDERYEAALLMAARVRLSEASGLADSASDRPHDFESLLAAKRSEKERATA